MNSTQFVGSGFYIDPSLELIWIPLAIQLIATLIGAFVGFSFVMLWDRRKRYDETKQIMRNILEAMIEELSDIKKGMNAPEYLSKKMNWRGKPEGFQGAYITITIPAFETAVNSGNFSLLKPCLQTKIMYCYNRITDLKTDMERMTSFYSTPIYLTDLADFQAKVLTENFDKRTKSALDEIEKTLPELHKAKLAI